MTSIPGTRWSPGHPDNVDPFNGAGSRAESGYVHTTHGFEVGQQYDVGGGGGQFGQFGQPNAGLPFNPMGSRLRRMGAFAGSTDPATDPDMDANAIFEGGGAPMGGGMPMVDPNLPPLEGLEIQLDLEKLKASGKLTSFQYRVALQLNNTDNETVGTDLDGDPKRLSWPEFQFGRKDLELQLPERTVKSIRYRWAINKLDWMMKKEAQRIQKMSRDELAQHMVQVYKGPGILRFYPHLRAPEPAPEPQSNVPGDWFGNKEGAGGKKSLEDVLGGDSPFAEMMGGNSDLAAKARAAAQAAQASDPAQEPNGTEKLPPMPELGSDGMPIKHVVNPHSEGFRGDAGFPAPPPSGIGKQRLKKYAKASAYAAGAYYAYKKLQEGNRVDAPEAAPKPAAPEKAKEEKPFYNPPTRV